MTKPTQLGWPEIEAIVRELPARHNLVIPKSVTPEPPPHKTSPFGRKRGALRQFRDARPRDTLHIKEFPDRWIVHVDLWNPHHHMVRHIAIDRGYTRFIHLLHWLEHGPAAATMAQPFAAAIA
ncbi:MAG TPA: hypothetical protein VI818_00175 [Candidatus Thermoplasmatota archaeon]|nr:hypothetical protein [Candidatus Thermoplasmatota archaeon]